MLDQTLQADCSRCAALCCVALAFDRSPLFAFDKPAGAPCPHLRPDHRCGIHTCREEHGFAGCARYDCAGAGQAATALFAGGSLGRSWQDTPELLPAMLEAFHILRDVHHFLGLLAAAGRLPLTAALVQSRTKLLTALQPPGGWTARALAQFDWDDLRRSIKAFLAALRPPGSC
jgi:hypothetical protein